MTPRDEIERCARAPPTVYFVAIGDALVDWSLDRNVASDLAIQYLARVVTYIPETPASKEPKDGKRE